MLLLCLESFNVGWGVEFCIDIISSNVYFLVLDILIL